MPRRFSSITFSLFFLASFAPSFATPLTDSATAPWKKDFQFTEKMLVYDFPEQQINYPVEIPAGIAPASLTLLAVTDPDVTVIPFQLSEKKTVGGALHATLSFRTDLPKGATRWFRLVSGFRSTGVPATSIMAPTLQPTSHPDQAILGNSLLLVEVPAGHQDFPQGKPLAQAPAPILSLSRTAQPTPPMATGSFTAPDALLVNSIDTKLVESGPVFARYEITYQFPNDKSFIVDLELRAGESHVAVAETVNGFTPDDQAWLRLNYGAGLLDPDSRLVLGNPGKGMVPFNATVIDPNDPTGASLKGLLTDDLNHFAGAYDRDVTKDLSAQYWHGSFQWLDYDPKLDKQYTRLITTVAYASNGFVHSESHNKCVWLTSAITVYGDRILKWEADSQTLSVGQSR